MDGVQATQERVTQLIAMIQNEEKLASESEAKSQDIANRLDDLHIRAQSGEDVSAEIIETKRARSESLFDKQDHQRAASKLKAQLIEAQEAMAAADKAAATERYNEIAKQRTVAEQRIEALCSDLVKGIAELMTIDAEQRIAATGAGITPGRAVRNMIENYIIYALKPVLGAALPRVTNRGGLTENDSMAK